MAKKKKGTAQKQPEAEPASPSTIPDPQTPVNIPTPSTANGASTDGTTTPNENGVKAEPTPEDKIKIADELKEKGNVAFKARKYEDAIKLYAEAIDIAPSQAAYYANRAAASIAIKQFKSALQDCQQARSLQQDSPQIKTLIRLARCQLATGSPGPALSTLREAQNLSAETTTDLWTLKSNAETMQRHLDSVSRAKSKGDWSLASAALGFAKQMLEGEGKETPTQWRCWNIEFRMARGDWDGAADAVRDAIRYENNSPDVHALRGKIFFLTNKSTDAANSLRHALTLDPEHGTARTLLKKVKQLEKIKDDGNAAFKQSKWEEACKKYAEALEIVGENPEEAQGGILRATLLSNRATAYSKVGTTESYDKALADLDVSVKLHPDNWKAVRTRARIHLAKDEFELAISDFREATELAESSSGAGVQVQSELREEIRKAEVLLKRSKEKDYYKILSLSRAATDPEIKKAYRRESLKHHPDKGGDEEAFKLVVEANAVLSDPEKRRRYDAGEDIDGQMNSEGAGAFPGGGVDLSEMLFAQMFGGHGGGGGFGGHPGGSPFGAGASSGRRGRGGGSFSYSQDYGF